MSIPLGSDPHRPAVHLRPPRGWINDPNGLVFHDGHYHVFFQYNPHGSRHGTIHWGHFRSPDLTHWQLLPPALAPTPGGYDADGCFSGNAVSDGDRLVAFYSAHREDRWWQSIAAADSHDGGLSWTKRPELVIPEPPDGTIMWRDPYVWRQDGRWRMLVGAALADGRGAAYLYTSDDLDQWTSEGPFLTSETSDSGDVPDTGWECPQYADFGAGSGALIVSDWHPQDGPRGTLVLLGSVRDGQFSAAAPVPLDYGPDLYAPALLPAADGRLLLWGWAGEARDPDWADEWGWSGLLTLPRELTLADDGTIHQQPARELLALRGPQTLKSNGCSTSYEPVDLGQVERCFDLTARLRATGSEEPVLRLVTTADDSEHLDIRIDPATRQLVVDRDHASLDPRAHGGSYRLPLPDAATETVELRLIVDHSVAELYLSTGQTLTLRFYPTGDDPWRIQAGGDLDYTVEAWELSPLTTESDLAEGDAA
ncbi:glycoside hydrolase family 32 protein [Streptomyces sp. SAS_272]|uniref:glycoside hydrolase family 32 protein n=1 Tax=Streptomyces sp. SAS_272 TaxID=3412747 RepID=UPI00403C57F4